MPLRELCIRPAADMDGAIQEVLRGPSGAVLAFGEKAGVFAETLSQQGGSAESGNEAPARGEMKNYALGRLKTGERNKSEAAYESVLQATPSYYQSMAAFDYVVEGGGVKCEHYMPMSKDPARVWYCDGQGRGD